MVDYKKLYYFLFSGITDVIEEAELQENNDDTQKNCKFAKIATNRSRRTIFTHG